MFLSSFHRDLGVLTEFQQGIQPLSRFESWNCIFLWSFKRGVRPPVEARLGTWTFSRGAVGESDLISCFERLLGVPFQSVQAYQFLSRVEVELCVLSNFGRNRGVPLEFP